MYDTRCFVNLINYRILYTLEHRVCSLHSFQKITEYQSFNANIRVTYQTKGTIYSKYGRSTVKFKNSKKNKTEE